MTRAWIRIDTHETGGLFVVKVNYRGQLLRSFTMKFHRLENAERQVAIYQQWFSEGGEVDQIMRTQQLTLESQL